MKTVSPNILMLALRLVFLPCLIWMVIVPAYRFTQNDYSDAPAIALIGLLFFIFFLVFIIMSLTGIFQIKYNEGTGQITFYRLYKSHTISVSDIAGYYQSTLKTKWKNYPWYFLVLKDGEIIELNEYNVKPLRDFYAFIVQSGVPCKGTKNSWYLYIPIDVDHPF